MRFAVAHKAATYLMVIFAYFAMVTGGSFSPAIAFGGFTALVASWWWEPPRIRYETWGWVWTVLSLFALVYSVLTAVLTGDFLGVGAQFLIWLIVAKAYNRRAARDWQQMYLLAFLMLVAGSVLNAELTYGLAFLGFVISSTWALTLFHLRREMEDNLLVKHAADRASERVEVRRILESRRIVGPRFFVGTAALSFGVFLGAAIVFLSLPRVGFGFFLKTRGGLTLAGFSDGVKLGGHGVIKSDPTVVMRVEIEPKVGARSAPEIHWRGVAFDLYRNGEWTRSKLAPETRQTLEWEYKTPEGRLAMRQRARRTLLWADRALPEAEIDALAATTVKQEIWLDPLDSDVLFGASNPRIVEYPNVRRRRGAQVERNDEVRLEHGSTIHYTVYSELASPPADELRAAQGPLPPNYAVYLQLPPEITARTRAKALEITAGATTNYDKAIAIQAWLVSNLTYTLKLEEPGTQEPVDFFLFDRKQGHCEYFASAFAVLARAAGIPVRQVNGFLGGEWNEYQGYVAVRAGDAHSWVEVFFPGEGYQAGDKRMPSGRWVTFDPTPPAGRSSELGRGGAGWRAKLSRFMDTVRFQWSKWVIDYDLSSQLELFRGVGRALKRSATAVKAAFVDAKDWAAERWPIGLAVTAAGAGLLVWRGRR
ncbi:MAG: transglutaminaseTgpA domain-containing protein, partial [Myxococcota bacterium]|nr:transglutaminaseTgpA domain-containing protein [Myxococcota bacterium]